MPDLEPNINPQVTAALLSTSSYIIDLVCLTIKLVESAVINGAQMVPKHSRQRSESSPDVCVWRYLKDLSPEPDLNTAPLGLAENRFL
jgi:L-2-hydroxyglutarate oxidase LhgO